MKALLKPIIAVVVGACVVTSTTGRAEEYLPTLSPACTYEVTKDRGNFKTPVKIVLVIDQDSSVHGFGLYNAEIAAVTSDLPVKAIAIPPGPGAITLTPYYNSPVQLFVCWWDLKGVKHCY
jgi:hypothetical protein